MRVALQMNKSIQNQRLVRDCMLTGVCALSSNMRLLECLLVILAEDCEKIEYFAVLDQRRHLIGVINKWDIFYASNKDKLCVGDIIQNKLIRIYADTSILEVRRVFDINNNLSALPVVSRENIDCVEGIVLRSAVLKKRSIAEKMNEFLELCFCWR